MTNFSELALTAFGPGPSARARLDELERVIASKLRKLEPGPSALAEIHDQLAVTNELLELKSRLPEAALKIQIGRPRPRGLLDEALEQLAEAHAAALIRAGLSTRVVDILRSWVDLTIEVRALGLQIQVLRAQDSSHAENPNIGEPTSPFGDPAAPLTAAELGIRLGLGDESVRQRERARKLFSILRPGRKRGREYPAFQAWPGVAGEPLERSLAALAPADGSVAYLFFTSLTDELGGLSPVEVLLGKPLSARRLEPDTTQLLNAPKEERLFAVEKAAAAMAAEISA